ncbi:hypothetical protein LUW10_06055 [Pseudomonas veronii]|uniref:hypothetical protein n=1 Tax=Pseudomonas veronii TaxID=76761 RepID=UPI001E39A0A6|nr:hypothetical protein [Pseudomonas veronii]UHH33317.1 hypothetical protein LUW10_06055 [Pseudomonas veronii]
MTLGQILSAILLPFFLRFAVALYPGIEAMCQNAKMRRYISGRLDMSAVPGQSNEPLSVSVEYDVMTLCGQVFDLSVVPEGFRLHASATGCDHFVDFIECINGTLSLTLKLPVSWDSPESLRNPAELRVIVVTTTVLLMYRHLSYPKYCR